MTRRNRPMAVFRSAREPHHAWTARHSPHRVLKVPAAGFEPVALGSQELARLSVWPELGYPARTEQKLISS
jgi:hypothetical protein